MRRTHCLLPTAFLLLTLFAAIPASAAAPCLWGIRDMTTISGIDPDGTSWSYVTLYYGWICADGYLDDERPYDPATGRPFTPPPPPPPAPTPSCSLNSCLGECDAHYLEDAGVEVVGDTIIEHYKVGCGLICRQMAN